MFGQDRNVIIGVLAEHFPRCFFTDPRQRLPLKKNIVNDIEALKLKEFETVDIQSAVDWYISNYGYQKRLAIPGNKRIDLDGKPVGTVTELEANKAVDKINEINAAKEARGLSNPHDVRVSPVPLRRIDTMTMKATADTRSDHELLTVAAKKIARAQTLLAGDDDDGLRAEITVPVLKKAIEDVQVVLARLKAGE
jgi:sRNA-binding protein